MALERFQVVARRRPVSLPGGAPAEPGTFHFLNPEDPSVARSVRSGDIERSPEPEDVDDELGPLKRADLDDIATLLDLNPAEFSNKEQVIAAIRDARAAKQEDDA